MAKQTLTVKTAEGTITRTTDRPYAYVTCARAWRKDVICRRAEEQTKSTISNRAYDVEMVAELEKGIVRFSHSGTAAEQIADHQAAIVEADRLLAGGIQAKLAEDLAQSDVDVAAPLQPKQGIWSSRLDLARKTYADLLQYHRDVRIYEVATGRQVFPAL